MKFKHLLVVGLLACVSSATLTSCNNKNAADTLNIVVLNKGYGREWIDTIAAKWTSETGNKVHINATASSDAVISKGISSRKNTDDLYISVGSEWKTYAAQGLLLPIDDLLEEEVDGVKLKNKVSSEYSQSIYFKNSNDETHSYRLPWISGLGGIYYNAKMFKDHHWEVPTTYEELLTLCEQIVNDEVAIEGQARGTVKPFVYTGQNTDYFDYTVFTWWGQLAGKDNIHEFLNYSSPDSFDVSKPAGATYAKLKEATQMWYDIFKNTKYVVEGSKSKSNHQAQTQFMNGYAAMMMDGEWIYNEMLGYVNGGDLPSNFECKIMPTPAKSTAQYKNTAYIVGEDQYIAIPASTIKPDLAKSFIKYIVSNNGCETFAEKAHGLIGYNFDIDSFRSNPNHTNTYVNSFLDYRSQVLNNTFTNHSSNPLYLNGKIDIWVSGGLRPFESMLGGTSIDSAFEMIAAGARSAFNS